MIIGEQLQALEQTEPVIGPLVAAKQAEIREKVTHLYEEDPRAVSYRLNRTETYELLETTETPLLAAVKRLETEGHEETVHAYRMCRLSLEDVHVLNGTREVHAKKIADIVMALDVSRRMIAEVARESGILPLFMSNNERHIVFETENAVLSMGGWYDLDQIQQLREKTKSFDAPQGYVGETNIMNATGLPSEAFFDICKWTEIKGRPFRNPAVGQVEYHYTETEVVTMLYFIKSNRDRLREKYGIAEK